GGGGGGGDQGGPGFWPSSRGGRGKTKDKKIKKGDKPQGGFPFPHGNYPHPGMGGMGPLMKSEPSSPTGGGYGGGYGHGPSHLHPQASPPGSGGPNLLGPRSRHGGPRKTAPSGGGGGGGGG
ncbi:unnamed protein product, partial [Pylaiella littoralis]